MNFVEEYKQKLQSLINNNGINPNALFQSASRVLKFPGANLHYTFSMVNLSSRDGIGTIQNNQKHDDVVTNIDANGNFTQPTFVTSSRNFRKRLQEEFQKEEQRGHVLILLDQESFINRRLRAGEII